ncbi:hypothetical protein RhiirC2_750666, partial [Rhizophagus irregularis]
MAVRIKRIFSNRLGTTYSETLHARDANSILRLGNRHMYRKRLFNFKYAPS